MLTRVGNPFLSSDYNRPLIFLDKLWGTGGCAVVYKSTSSGVVIKLSLQDEYQRYDSRRGLEIEAAIYERLEAEAVPFIPQYYGLYEWSGGLALLVSDEGTSLSDLGVKFHQLPYSTK